MEFRDRYDFVDYRMQIYDFHIIRPSLSGIVYFIFSVIRLLSFLLLSATVICYAMIVFFLEKYKSLVFCLIYLFIISLLRHFLTFYKKIMFVSNLTEKKAKQKIIIINFYKFN